MWPPSLTSTLPGRSPSTSPRRACQWCRATCRRRSSTRRRWRAWRRPAAPAPASTSTTTTPGTSTTPDTVTRLTGTRPSTTRRRRRRRTTTWRRPGMASAGYCWAAHRCTTSTSPSTGPRSTPRTTSTLPPARPTTRLCPVWKRRCKTLQRTSTGSEPRETGCEHMSQAAPTARPTLRLRAPRGSTCLRATPRPGATRPRAKRAAPATSSLRAVRRVRPGTRPPRGSR